MSRTIKNSYDKKLTFENLMSAYERAKIGKGNRKEVIKFEMDLETNICNIFEELKEEKYRVGKYKVFVIHEPKERVIKSLPFKDRVVQQWYIEEFIKPYIVPRLIGSTCACIEGRGNLYAVNICQKYMRIMRRKYNSYYVLKCDIEKYFYSIDKTILFDIMKRYISDKKLLNLTRILIFDSIDDISIHIGNLSSKWFANIYMNELGRYIKEQLKVKFLVIYMDDVVILCKTKEEANYLKNKLNYYISKYLNLKFNKKTKYYPNNKGINFCGYRIFEDYKLIRKRSKRKINKNIKIWHKKYNEGKLNYSKMRASYKSWIAYAKHADTYRYRLKINGKLLLHKIHEN